MQQAEYDQWADRHATTFGFRDADLKMLLSWYDVLGCYRREDLDEADRRLARGQYPSWRADHLKALTQLLADVAAERAEAASAPPTDEGLGTCATCGGTGRVVVPHPRAVRDGHWVPLKLTRGGAHYYTAAVACSCALGRWYQQQGKDAEGRGMMSLEAYEQGNPNWRAQLWLRETEARQVTRLAPRRPWSGLERQWQADLDRALSRLEGQAGGQAP